MTLDPVVRLAALHLPDAKQAKELLLDGCSETGALPAEITVDPIEDASERLVELVEVAICDGSEELTMPVTMAELVVVALKSRKRQNGRPSLTPAERIRRNAVISIARARAKQLRAEDMSASEASEMAAVEAARFLGERGDNLAWTTIAQKLKRRGK